MQAMMMAEGPVDASMRTLWIGDLAYWQDDAFLYQMFSQTGELVSVKVIRNKLNGQSEGYGFLEFRTHEGADVVLRTYNGQPMPNTSDQVFRLNWAAFGVGKVNPEGSMGVSADHSIFVGDLAPDVTDFLLQEHFRQFFPSVRSAKVITDPGTGRSKGYGFVRFASEPERDRALLEMNGQYLSSRPIRVSLATAKKATGSMTSGHAAPAPSDLDPTNTTLFIGGLSASVTEDQLRNIFGRYGEIIYTKIPQGKGCGFVQFVDRKCAETAMGEMNGQVLGNSAVRISWGRSSSSKAPPAAGASGAGAFGSYTNGSFASAAGFNSFDQSYGSYSTTYSSDPYSAAYSSYGQAYPGTASFNGMSQASTAGVAAQAGSAVMGGAGMAQFDPLAPVDVDKLNAAFMQRHQPALLGSFLRAS